MDYKQLSDFRSTTTVTADDLIYSQNTSSGIEQKTTVRQLINFIISNFAPLRVSIPVTTDGQAVYTGLTYTPGLVNLFIVGMRLPPNMYQASDGVSITILDPDVLSVLKSGMTIEIDAIVSTAVADVASMSDVLALYPGNQASIGSLTGNELLSAQQGQYLYSMTSRKFANYVLSTLAPLRTSLAVTTDGQATYTTSGYIPLLTNLFILGRRLSPSSYQALDGTNIVITDTNILSSLKAGMSIEMDALVSLAVSGAATPAQVAALDPANQSSAATLIGNELVSIRQGANLVASTLSNIAQWAFNTFTGFTRTATGALPRSIVDKLSDTVNAKDFGAKGDGVTDDTMALQNFINFITTNGLRGEISIGTYLLSTTLNIPIQAKAFELYCAGGGTGINLITTGTFPAAPVVQVLGSGTNSGWSISGMSINPGPSGAGSAIVGIRFGSYNTPTQINGYQYSTVKNVEVSGFPVLYEIVHARMITFENCAGWNQTYQNANVCLRLIQNGYFTGDINFYNCQFVSSNLNANNFAVDIESTVGPYNANNGNCQLAGVKFTNCDFYAGSKSVSANVANGGALSDIWFTGCQIDQQVPNGFYFLATGAGSIIFDIHLGDCYVAASTNSHITFAATTGASIGSIFVHHNFLWSATGTSINFYGVGSTVKNVHIDHNSFVDSNSTVTLIEMNTVSLFEVTNNIATNFLSTNKAGHLVQIENGCTNFTVKDNLGAAWVTGASIVDLSGNVPKTITGNDGYNPIGLQTVNVGASPFAYVNTTGAAQVVTVANGTVSALNVSGIAITVQTDNQIVVPAGATLTVTYSAIPNMYSIGL